MNKTLSARWAGVEARTIVLLGIAVGLHLVSAYAVMTFPLAVSVALPLGLLGAYAVLTNPGEAFIAALVGRLVVDLLWWLEGAFGLGVMEMYSGAVLVLLSGLALLRVEEVRRHFYAVGLLGWVALVLLAATQTQDLRQMLEQMARTVSPVLFMLLATVTIRSQERRRVTLGLMGGIGALAIGVGYFHYSAGQMDEILLDGYHRLRGGYTNIHNHAHAMSLFVTLAVLGYFTSTSWRVKTVAALYGVAALGLLYLTYVRTPVVGIAAFLLVFLSLNRRWGLLGLLVGVAVVLSGYTVFQDRFGELLGLFTQTESVDTEQVGSGRIAMWTSSMSEFVREPPFVILFGAGFGGGASNGKRYAGLSQRLSVDAVPDGTAWRDPLRMVSAPPGASRLAASLPFKAGCRLVRQVHVLPEHHGSGDKHAIKLLF